MRIFASGVTLSRISVFGYPNYNSLDAGQFLVTWKDIGQTKNNFSTHFLKLKSNCITSHRSSYYFFQFNYEKLYFFLNNFNLVFGTICLILLRLPLCRPWNPRCWKWGIKGANLIPPNSSLVHDIWMFRELEDRVCALYVKPDVFYDSLDLMAHTLMVLK